MALWKTGPQVAGREVEWPLGTWWRVLKDVKNATVPPKAGAIYALRPVADPRDTTIAGLRKQIGALEAELAKVAAALVAADADTATAADRVSALEAEITRLKLAMSQSHYYPPGLSFAANPKRVTVSAVMSSPQEAQAATLSLLPTLGGARHTVGFSNDDSFFAVPQIAAIFEDYQVPDGCGGFNKPGLDLVTPGIFVEDGTNGLYGNQPNTIRTTWTVIGDLIKRPNVAPINHSYAHSRSPGFTFADKDVDAGLDGARLQLQRNYDEFLTRFNYKMNIVCQPSGQELFITAADQIGNIIGFLSGSWGGSDGSNGEPARPMADGYDPFFGFTAEYFQRRGYLIEAQRAMKMALVSRRVIDAELSEADIATLKTYVDDDFAYDLAHITDGHFVHAFGDHKPFDTETLNALGRIRLLIEYILGHASVASNGLWWPTTQGLVEWGKLRELATISAPVVSGNTATWTLDLSALPDHFRWHNFTPQVNGGAVSTITVDGAESVSYVPGANKCNVYKRAGFGGVGGAVKPQPVAYLTDVELPRRVSQYYSTNNRREPVDKLIDGDATTKMQQNPATMVLIPNEIIEDFDPREDTIVKRYVLRDGPGSWANYPTIISLFRRDTQQWVDVVSYDGTKDFAGGPVPYPVAEFFISDRQRIRTLGSSEVPMDLAKFGDYRPQPAEVLPARTRHPLKKQTGINGLYADWMIDDHYEYNADGSVKVDVNGKKILFGLTNSQSVIADKANKTNIYSKGPKRIFTEWQDIMPLEGQVAFGPARGGWNLVALHQWFFDNGEQAIWSMKGCPQWVQDTYPANYLGFNQDGSPVGLDKLPFVKFADINKRDTVAAWRYAAEVMRQYVICFGPNKNVNPAEITLWMGHETYNGAPPANVKRIGLNLLPKGTILSGGNETDTDYLGDKVFNTGAQNAASCWATKKAVESIAPGWFRIAWPASARIYPDQLREGRQWCIDHPEKDAQGNVILGYDPVSNTVKLSWDVDDYHLYFNEQGENQETDGPNHRISADTTPYATRLINDIIYNSSKYTNGNDVIITEMGADLNQDSPLSAKAYGSRDAQHAQMDVVTRDCVFFGELGVAGTCIYWREDAPEVFSGANPGTTKFETSGLQEYVRPWPLRKTAVGLKQMNEIMGDALCRSILSTTGCRVSVWDQPNGSDLYVLRVPSHNDTTATYPLSLPKGGTLYQLNPTGDAAFSSSLPAGMNQIPVTETLCFVQANL